MTKSTSKIKYKKIENFLWAFPATGCKPGQDGPIIGPKAQVAYLAHAFVLVDAAFPSWYLGFEIQLDMGPIQVRAWPLGFDLLKEEIRSNHLEKVTELISKRENKLLTAQYI